jgi:DNA repair protein RecN (Recombination protein N)
VLLELRVENLLLIEEARLALAPGLNVLTGETGAGKTVLAHALDLLLGGRARTGIVRPGAAEAYVEGVFELPDPVAPGLLERLPEDAQELVLARRVGRDGRTRAYLNGRALAIGDLRELAGELIVFYGQHEHRKLTLASAQLEILDDACGAPQRVRRQQCAAAHGALRELERELDELQAREGGRDRELDLIAFELSEIEEIGPDVGEHADLLAERERLRHLEALRLGALAAEQALSNDTDGGARTLMAGAEAALEAVTGVDPALDALSQRHRSLVIETADLAAELQRYVDGLEAEPGRLEVVEERLAALERLMRKHGGSIQAVLDHAEHCRRLQAQLRGAEEARGELQRGLLEARATLDAQVAALRKARQAAAPRLARAVRERLAKLAMDGASFEIEVDEREPGPAGADTVEFRVAPNPGVPAGPLREIASGGELSRIMLALLGVANAQGRGVLVFDEVDAGIGGQTARAVGAQLRELAAGRQVLCITHLPQIASLGARHFSISKDSSVEPARTTVAELPEADVVSELVRMLGSDGDDAAARRHATELRRAA